MKKIYWALLCILVIISSFVLAQVYSTFEIPIRVTTPTPSEFRNGTSICLIGGSQGILNCTGNITGNYIFGNLAYATGLSNQSNSTTWWANLRGWTNTYFFRNATGYLDFNETKLNLTILSRGQVFNETAMIKSVNTTANIMNLGFWNKTQSDAIFLNKSGTNANQNINISPYNLTLNWLKFPGGGYVYDNGTALILGHN